jgi:hypothetical protein
MKHLAEYKQNITSQFGEDGMIEELFSRIGIRSKVCVEFGAWDGKHCSNTWKLWHNEGWSAVLIESDPIRIEDLKRSTANYPKVVPYLAFVTPEGPDSLDNILTKTIPTQTVDLMSIDIDSNDYQVFEALNRYLPRVVIIEYNPTIPPHLHVVQELGEYFGCSARALYELATSKGYTFVAMTLTNMFFVQNEEVAKLGLPSLPTPEELFDKNSLTYTITSFGGVPFVTRVPMYTNLSSKRLSAASIPQIKSRGQLIPIFFGKNELLLQKIFNKGYRIARTALKKTPLRKIAQQLRIKQNIAIARTRHAQKRKRLSIVKKDFPSIHDFVETGTYHGDMVRIAKDLFERVYSIELSSQLYAETKKMFRNDKNVFLFQGDSAEVLPTILQKLKQPALFWLDAHYSKGETARGSIDTPILSELQAILSDESKKHVILIDDARYFIGQDGYPTLKEMESFVHERNSDLQVFVEDDIIHILPKKL